jgi:hypothetical protein
VQIGCLPPTGRISSVTAPVPSRHRQPTTGRRQEISLPTSDRSVGEMNFLKSGFEPNRTASIIIFYKYIYNQNDTDLGETNGLKILHILKKKKKTKNKLNWKGRNPLPLAIAVANVLPSSTTHILS